MDKSMSVAAKPKRHVSAKTPLRRYVEMLPAKTLPRTRVLEDGFFSLSVGFIAAMPKEDIDRRLTYMVGLGAKGRMALENIINDLKQTYADQSSQGPPR